MDQFETRNKTTLSRCFLLSFNPLWLSRLGGEHDRKRHDR